MADELDDALLDRLHKLVQQDIEAAGRVATAANPLRWLGERLPYFRRKWHDNDAAPILRRLTRNPGNTPADLAESSWMRHLTTDNRYKKLRRDLVEESFLDPSGKARGPAPTAPAGTWAGGLKDVLQPPGTLSGLAVWVQKRLGNDVYQSLMDTKVGGLDRLSPIAPGSVAPGNISFKKFIDLLESGTLNQQYTVRDQSMLLRSLDDWAERAQKLHGRNSNYQKLANVLKAKLAAPVALAAGGVVMVGRHVDAPQNQDLDKATLKPDSPYVPPTDQERAGDAFMKQHNEESDHTQPETPATNSSPYGSFNLPPVLGPKLNPMFDDNDTSDWAKYVKSSNDRGERFAALNAAAPPDFNEVVGKMREFLDDVTPSNVARIQRELSDYLANASVQAEKYMAGLETDSADPKQDASMAQGGQDAS